jgi:heme-NO-binding protein
MKGTIVRCLEELIRTKHGDDQWKAILVESGMAPTTLFFTTAVVPDDDVVRLLAATATVLGITLKRFSQTWNGEAAV